MYRILSRSDLTEKMQTLSFKELRIIGKDLLLFKLCELAESSYNDVIELMVDYASCYDNLIGCDEQNVFVDMETDSLPAASFLKIFLYEIYDLERIDLLYKFLDYLYFSKTRRNKHKNEQI
jgi:hypothetical protein